MTWVGSGSVMAASLPPRGRSDEPAGVDTSYLRPEPALAAIRSSRFYAWDATPRSHPTILRVPPAGTSAVAAGRPTQAVHPPDLAECPAVGGRRHPGAGQANRHGGTAYSWAGAGDRLPDLPWRAQPGRVVVPDRKSTRLNS